MEGEVVPDAASTSVVTGTASSNAEAACNIAPSRVQLRTTDLWKRRCFDVASTSGTTARSGAAVCYVSPSRAETGIAAVGASLQQA